MKNTFTLFLALALVISASAKKENYTRNYDKSFDVNADVLLETETSFGTLEIEEWEENSVQIHVEISIDAKSERDAEEIFDDIDVDIKGDKYRVLVETDMSGNWNERGNADVEIRVFIKCPDRTQLKVDHSFGSAFIGSFRSAADIHTSFGSVEIEGLSGEDNKVKSEYGEAQLGTVNSGKYIIEFGGMEIKKVTGDIDLNSSYSSLEIHDISASAETVEIDNEFGSVDINIDERAGYRVEANCDFGDIDLPGNAKVQRSVREMTSYEVECTIGENPSGEIIINTSFGDVSIDYR